MAFVYQLKIWVKMFGKLASLFKWLSVCLQTKWLLQKKKRVAIKDVSAQQDKTLLNNHRVGDIFCKFITQIVHRK